MEVTQKNIHDLIALTKKASDAIMEVYNARTTIVEYKSDNSPITQADIQSHAILMEGLPRLFPDIPIVSEESDKEHNQKLVGRSKFWLIDPIDGTQDFVNGTGEFCIAVGLIVNNKPSFGLIVAPTFDTVYYGGPNMGSFKKVGGLEPEQISVRAHTPHIVGVSRSQRSESTRSFIDKYFPGSESRQIGSMLKQAKLAEGEIDVYPTVSQPLSLWDAAAGNAIIAGAGGYMTRLDGTALDYGRRDLKIGDFIARATEDLF